MSTKGSNRWLRRRSPTEILLRLRQATAIMRERRGPLGKGVEPSDAELLASLPAEASTDAGAWTSLRERFASTARATALPGWRDPAATAGRVRSLDPDEASRLTNLAEAALVGRLALLGAGELSVGRPVQWHADPHSGTTAPLRHWSRIAHLDTSVVGDHKFTWEVNRHRHLVLFGQAYLLTGDRRFADAHARDLGEWLDANPPKLGINWGSSLEIAFRTVSWCWSLHLLRYDESLTGPLFARALKVLLLNGRHIETHLSTFYAPNTHLTGEALGLLYLGLSFPELRDAARWRMRGWEILRTELDRQVFADGTYYEQSTYYQRYVADFALHAAILGQQAGLAGADEVRATAGRVCDVLDAMVRPDGSIPLIGDDDGGTLLSLTSLRPGDIRPTLALAAATLNRPALSPAAQEGMTEATWVLGREERRGDDPVSRPASRVFPDGGLVVMRQGRGASNQLVFDAGPHGAQRTRAVHSHADALSIDVTVGGVALLVDPGTYSYVGDPAERDRLRLAASHNTVTLGDQSSSDPAGPFGWSRTTDARLDAWCADTTFAYVRGSHSGLRAAAPLVEHVREVLQLPGLGWLVRDRVIGSGNEVAVAHFHAAPGCEVDETSRGTRTLWLGERGLQLTFSGTEGIATEEDWVSPLYGRREHARTLRVMLAAEPARDAVTLLRPVGRADVPALVDASRTPGGWILGISAGEDTWTVQFGPGLATQGALEGDAQVRFEHREAASTESITTGMISTYNLGPPAGAHRLDAGQWVVYRRGLDGAVPRKGAVMRSSRGA